MKKMNKSLLTMVLVALMAFVCAFVSLGFVNSGVSASADTLARPTTSETAAASDFYVKSGARVRIVEGESGISFSSFVTKKYHDQLTANGTVEVEYFATAQVAGGANWSAIRFPIQPSFAEGAADTEVFELRTYINFNSLDDDDEARRLAAYATDFTIETYVNAGGTYFKAADAENGIARSMQAVANAAYLNWTSEKVDGYTQADVQKYYTLGARSERATAYQFSDNSGYVALPDVDGTANPTVEMYLGAKSIGEFTYNADKGVYAGDLTGAVDAKYVSAFVDGKVYSTVAANGIKITNAEEFKQLLNNTTTNAYVLENDIDLSSITEWAATDSDDAAFKGTLDGLQNSITDYTVRSGGVFGRTNGATIRSLHVEVKDYADFRYSGTLVKRSFGTVYENVYVDVLSQNQTSTNSASGLFGIAGGAGTNTVKNCVVVMRAISVAPSFQTAIAVSDGDAFFVTRVEGVTNVINSYGLNGTSYPLNFAGCEVYADKLLVEGKTSSNAAITSSSVSGILDLDSTKLANDFLKACYAKTKEAFTVTELTQDNIQEKLMGATSGYFVLTEDINMASMTWAPTGGTFSGVLDGNGFAIKNFTAPTGYSGLLPHVNNAVIRNLNFHVKNNTDYSALAGQVIGPVLIENCVIDIDTISGNHAGLFTIIQGEITAKNVIVNIDTAAATYGVGFLGGRASASKNIVVSNCYFVSGDGKLTNVYEGDNYAVNAETGVVTEGTVGTDNALAVAGEDYKLYTSLNALGEDIVAGILPKDLAKGASKLGLVTAISTVDELEAMRSATSGYFYLANDIDMDGKAFATTLGDVAFSGTFNGGNHTISNFNNSIGQGGALFYRLSGATVKNLAVTNATLGGSNAGIIARRAQGNTTVENVYAHITSGSSSAGLFGTLEGSSATVVLKDSTVVVDSGCGSYLNGSFAGNITVKSSYFAGVDKGIIVPGSLNGVVQGTEGVDYFKYVNKAELISDAIGGKTTMTDFVKKALLANQTTAINQDNIADLQNVTSGYIYLTEDVDMAEFTAWAPASGFAATLDGNGYTIKNFTAPASHVGLVGRTAAGATIRNLNLHVVSNTSSSALVGRVGGATTVTNCKIIVDTLTGSSAGVISNVIQGALTVKDVYIAVRNDSGVSGRPGIVAGGEASSHNVTVSNVYAFTVTGLTIDVFKGDNCNNETLAETTIGTDGALAENGVDYFFYVGGDIADADNAGTLNADFKAWLDENGFINEITAENIAELSGTIVNGYYYLTEDVDMATVDSFAPFTLYGVFNGKSHVISNGTTALFQNTYYAAIKNVIIKDASLTGYNLGGLIINIQKATTVENVIIDLKEFTSYAGGGIVKTVAANANFKNVLVIVNASTANAENGLIAGGRYDATLTATIENVYVVDKATGENKVTKLCGLRADGTDSAKLSADPVIVTSETELEEATMPADLVDLIDVYNPSFFG